MNMYYMFLLAFFCDLVYAHDLASMCNLPTANPTAAYVDAIEFLTQNGTHILNVCGYQVSPVCSCIGDTLTGFMPKLWTEVAAYMGLDKSMYKFTCWDNVVDLTANLALGLDGCDVSVADNNVLPAYLLEGVRFPLAVYARGLTILISSQSAGNYWSFFDAFSLNLWIAFIVTLVGSAFILYTLERFSVKESELIGQQGLGGLLLTYWSVLGQAVGVAGMSAAESWGARIMSWTIGFMVLVIIALFTANTTAFVTTRAVTSSITGFGGLVNQVVGTWEGYQGVLDVYSPSEIIYLPWTSLADENAMIHGLLKGEYAALVIDLPFANYAASLECGVGTVGTQVNTVPIGLAFAPYVPMWVSLAFQNAMVTLEDQKYLIQDLTDQYLDVSPKCVLPSDSSSLVQVELIEVAGLWFILAVAWCFGLASSIYAYFKRKRAAQRPDAPETEPEESMLPLASLVNVKDVSLKIRKAKKVLIGHSHSNKKGEASLDKSQTREMGEATPSASHADIFVRLMSTPLRDSMADVARGLVQVSTAAVTDESGLHGQCASSDLGISCRQVIVVEDEDCALRKEM